MGTMRALCCDSFLRLPFPPRRPYWRKILKFLPTIVSHVFAGSEFALILLEHPEDGGSVLTKESMDALWALDATIVGIEVRLDSILSAAA